MCAETARPGSGWAGVTEVHRPSWWFPLGLGVPGSLLSEMWRLGPPGAPKPDCLARIPLVLLPRCVTVGRGSGLPEPGFLQCACKVGGRTTVPTSLSSCGV